MAPHALHSFLDIAVPWVAFAYGCIMIFVFQQPKLIALAKERLPAEYRARFFAHLPLAWVCLVVGGLWILQDLWMT